MNAISMFSALKELEWIIYVSGLFTIGGIGFLIKEIIQSIVRFYFSRQYKNGSIDRRRETDGYVHDMILTQKEILNSLNLMTNITREMGHIQRTNMETLTAKFETLIQVFANQNK